MFISELTKNGIHFRAHPTAQAAVTHLLAEIGPDHGDAFRASKDGQAIEMDASREHEFWPVVHASEDSAWRTVFHFHDEEYLLVSTRLKEAIAAWNEGAG